MGKTVYLNHRHTDYTLLNGMQIGIRIILYLYTNKTAKLNTYIFTQLSLRLYKVNTTNNIHNLRHFVQIFCYTKRQTGNFIHRRETLIATLLRARTTIVRLTVSSPSPKFYHSTRKYRICILSIWYIDTEPLWILERMCAKIET